MQISWLPADPRTSAFKELRHKHKPLAYPSFIPFLLAILATPAFGCLLFILSAISFFKLQPDMNNFTVKTYTATTTITPYHFFILSKGMKSGKPSCTPWKNCFVVLVNSPEEKERLYWLAYALWKTKKLFSILRGSVISFITIYDYKKQLSHALANTVDKPDAIFKMVRALELLDEKERNAQERIKTIATLRQSIITACLRL